MGKCCVSRPHQSQTVDERWCYSQMEVTKRNFLWIIDNFRYRCENGDVISSSKFPASSNNRVKWRICLHTQGPDKDYLSLYLKAVSYNRTVNAKYEFSILDMRDTITNTKRSETTKRFATVNGCFLISWGYPVSFGFPKFIKRDFLLDENNMLLRGDRLIILCEVSVFEDSKNLSGHCNDTLFKIPACNLSDDLGQLLTEQKFSDVVLNANGRTFAVHKAILAARSPVFSAMFTHETQENKLNKVEITDVNHKVLKDMLHYMYTGKVSNMENTAEELLAAADKYILHQLKAICEEYIIKNLSIDNAAKVLILADIHSSDKLKTSAIDFIKVHASDVIATDGWRSISQMHPLVAEISRVWLPNVCPR